jgi:hypothetical protein
MRAIAVDQFGGLASVHDVPIPEIGRDEVLVRVRGPVSILSTGKSLTALKPMRSLIFR